MASRFIESLLLGLPVPGIFLSLEKDTQRYLILDGQQRLKTLQFFNRGLFEPTGKEFALAGVQRRFLGATMRKLEPEQRRKLSNAVIHATIIRQDEPSEEQTSIYHVFERLNTGGKQLAPQEIRSALFYGPLVQKLNQLNQYPAWRTLYGAVSPQLRDVELIVRFLAFYYFAESYSAPMKTFLNRYMGRNRNLDHQSGDEIENLFVGTIEVASTAFQPRPFKPQRALNAAVFDSIMVALARRISMGLSLDADDLNRRYAALLQDAEFTAGSVRATANEQRVAQRFNAAERHFGK
jgi:hypothetical protein